MQLKPSVPAKPGHPPRLRRTLMAASCALLGGVGTARADAAPDPAPDSAMRAATAASDASKADWQVDAAVLYYKESAGRVQAAEPVVSVRHDFGDEHVLNLKFTYDSLTGGSPNGALPSASPQTFVAPSGTSLTQNSVPQTYTTPSGKTVTRLDTFTLYTTPAGQLPLDTTFKDQRFALDGNWSQPLGEATKLNLGAGLSSEHDWAAATGNIGLSHDFFQHNTTLSFGVNGEYDRIKPVGGVPVALSDYALFHKGNDETRSSAGAQLGITQVLSRRWLVRANLNYDRSSGYQTDPYKIVSQVNPDGTIFGYRYENRPDTRSRKSVYLESRLALRDDDALSFSYRRLQDDWGIKSDTAELKYHLALNDSTYVEPHVRWYQQSAANFYQLYLNAGTPLPTYVSADARLAAFSAPSFGLKVGHTDSHGNELSLRVDYYQQNGKNVAQGPGELAGLDLYPGMKAIMLQVGWRFGF